MMDQEATAPLCSIGDMDIAAAANRASAIVQRTGALRSPTAYRPTGIELRLHRSAGRTSVCTKPSPTNNRS